MQLTKISAIYVSQTTHSVEGGSDTLEDLGKRATVGSLCHIPFQNILFWNTRLPRRINSPTPTPPKRPDYDDPWPHTAIHAHRLADLLPHNLQQRRLVRKRFDSGEILARPARALLPRPHLERESRPSEAGIVAKGSDTTAGCVGEEFEVEQRAATTGPAGEDGLPAGLLFVAVGKHDVRVWERRGVVLREFFEGDDVGILRRGSP